MSKPWEQPTEQQETDRWADVPEQVRETWEHFRESRLYVQAILSVGVLLIAMGVSLLPEGVAPGLRRAFTWTAHHDYDFAGQWGRASEWARARGGWGTAVGGVFTSPIDQARAWLGPVLVPTAATDGGPKAVASNQDATGTTGTSKGVGTAAGPLMPVAGAVLRPYGWVKAPNGNRLHEGLDILAPAGSAVVAVADGTVLRVTADPELGVLIEINHTAVVAIYGQVASPLVRPGQSVKQGTVLASVARATGTEKGLEPHLHFEVRTPGAGVSVDPASYLGLGGKKL